MFPTTNGLPTPLATLDEVFDGGDSSEKPMKVFIGHNMGNRTFLTLMPMHEFFSLSEVANDPARDGELITQRKLDPVHAHKLAVYLLKGLLSGAIERREIQDKQVPAALTNLRDKLGRQPYMALQPLVVNIRDCNSRGADIRGERMLDRRTEETAGFRIYLSQRHVLWVVDGQHRRRAMQLVFDFLEAVRTGRAYPKKGNLLPFADGEALTQDELKAWEECFEVGRSYCTVMVEVHLGLAPEAERQLFHDLNRLGKRVDTSLALQFDSSNPVNLFIKDELIDGLEIRVTETDVKNLQDDDGRILRKDLVAINAVLLFNKGNITGASPAMLYGKTPIALKFWTAIKNIPGFGEQHARLKTVAAQPVLLKAISKLVYDFSFSNRRPQNGDALTATLLERLSDIDFSHDNPMWRYYELPPDQRRAHGLDGLTEYLPVEAGANKDLGGFQGGFMRFSSKHNDIMPILGDMIRWRLGLPVRRHGETKGIGALAA